MSEENLYKLNISGGKHKKAKGLTKVVQVKEITPIIGKKIGDIINGGLIGLPGYELKITGGSDNSGIPMRFDVHGPVKKKILLATGPCYNPDRSGKKRRKVVRGNEITDDMKQVNMIVEKFGKAKLFESEKEEKKE